MPIALTNPATIPAPNTISYSLGLHHSIYGGKLHVSVELTLAQANVDENGVWTKVPIEMTRFNIEDLEEYAIAHPDLAPQITTVWEGLNNLVAALNTTEHII